MALVSNRSGIQHWCVCEHVVLLLSGLQSLLKERKYVFAFVNANVACVKSVGLCLHERYSMNGKERRVWMCP